MLFPWEPDDAAWTTRSRAQASPPAAYSRACYALAMVSNRRSPITGMSILVVEDDDDVREVLGDALTEEGAQVSLAEHGQRAIDLILAGLQPDVIVLDLMMPVVDGWAIWRWLQETPERQRLPVVVLSASGLRPGEMGKAHVLAKGIGIGELVKAIHETSEAWA